MIVIVGIGFIGGFLVIMLKENGFVIKVLGVDICFDNIDKVIWRRLIDEEWGFVEVVDELDIVVLVIFVDVMFNLLLDMLDCVDK